MFFALSKILDLGVSPIAWTLALIATGAIVVWRRPQRRRLALGFLIAAFALLCFFSLQPVSNAMLRALEYPLQNTERADVIYDAAIVLGGAMSLNPTATTSEPQYNDASERVLAGFDLLRSGRVKNVLFSGGDPDPQGPPVVEAALEAQQLERWGMPADRIVIEGTSRNTHENAVESAKVIAQRGWKRLLLVTSAAHMDRAAGCFRAAGLSFDTRAVDIRSYDPAKRHGSALPRAESLNDSAAALHELTGRIVYRLRGYSK